MAPDLASPPRRVRGSLLGVIRAHVGARTSVEPRAVYKAPWDAWEGQVFRSYGPLLNRRRVIRGSIAAELSTFWEKEGAIRTPRTLSAGTPLDCMFPM